MLTKHCSQTCCAPGRDYPSPPPAGLPPQRRPGMRQRCSHMEHFFRPDTQSSDVEIGISHSEGPAWPRRSAGGSRVHPLASPGGRCRPESASAHARASRAPCAAQVCSPSARPTPAHTQRLSAQGHVPPSGECISGMQSAFTNRCPRGRGGGAPNTAWKLPEGSL